MTRHRIRITLITVFVTTIGLQAADLALSDGYGDTQWGQSAEEVQSAIVDLEEIKGEPLLLRQAGKDGKIIQKTEYAFTEDQLLHVSVYFKMPDAPARGKDKDGLRYIKEQLDAKYKAVRKEFNNAGIRVSAGANATGHVVVSYHNTKIENEIVKRRRAEAKEAKEKEYQEGERHKKMTETGVGDLL